MFDCLSVLTRRFIGTDNRESAVKDCAQIIINSSLEEECFKYQDWQKTLEMFIVAGQMLGEKNAKRNSNVG